MDTTVERIVDLEWNMLLQSAQMEGAGNIDGDKKIFSEMRSAQFSAWSEKAAESYLTDLNIAAAGNRNLIIEKNMRAMKFLAPEQYEEIKEMLEPLSEQKEALVTEISDILIGQMEQCYKKYPNVSTGQQLRSTEDTDEMMSVETHQKAEFMTYSETTLAALSEQIKELEVRGENLAENILSNSIRLYGFDSLAAADKAIEQKKNEVFVTPNLGGCCGAGGCPDDGCSEGGCAMR